MATAALGRRASWQLLQSDFGRPDHNGNFEVVVLEDRGLVHYFHDNGVLDSGWKFKQVISNKATGAGSIIQSDFGSGAVGNFEVVVLEPNLLTPGQNQLVHYFHDNADVDSPWKPALVITPNAPDAGSIIQSDFGRPDHNGNFELVVLEPVLGAPGQNQLVHYFHDNSDLGRPWTRTGVISPDAKSAGSIIQSDFGSGSHGHGNFEVVVLEPQPNNPGTQLVHYFFNQSDPGRGWQRSPHIISAAATGQGSIIQSDFGTPGHPGNFEVVVLEVNKLVHYFHDNSNVDSKWKGGTTITNNAIGPGSIIQSDFGTPGHLGNFEVVVPEADGLFHYFRDNSTLEWHRTGQFISNSP